MTTSISRLRFRHGRVGVRQLRVEANRAVAELAGPGSVQALGAMVDR
jgi:hypothetical protein